MTKRYMDFTPVKNKVPKKTGASQGRATATKPVARSVVKSVAKPTRKSATRLASEPAQRTAARPVVRPTLVVKQATKPIQRSAARPITRTVVRPAQKPVQKVSAANSGLSMSRSGVKLGEIEDVSPKFVRTDVPKRPLNDGNEIAKSKETATNAKAKRIGGRLKFRSAKNSNKKGTGEVSQVKTDSTKKATATSLYKVPTTPFINQDKVTKRPLSKNVYTTSARRANTGQPLVAEKKTGKTTTIIDKPEKDSRIGMVVAIILTIILGAVAGTVAFLLLPK